MGLIIRISMPNGIDDISVKMTTLFSDLITMNYPDLNADAKALLEFSDFEEKKNIKRAALLSGLENISGVLNQCDKTIYQLGDNLMTGAGRRVQSAINGRRAVFEGGIGKCTLTIYDITHVNIAEERDIRNEKEIVTDMAIVTVLKSKAKKSKLCDFGLIDKWLQNYISDFYIVCLE